MSVWNHVVSESYTTKSATKPGSSRNAGRESLIFRVFVHGRSRPGAPLWQIWTRPRPGSPQEPHPPHSDDPRITFGESRPRPDDLRRNAPPRGNRPRPLRHRGSNDTCGPGLRSSTQFLPDPGRAHSHGRRLGRRPPPAAGRGPGMRPEPTSRLPRSRQLPGGHRLTGCRRYPIGRRDWGDRPHPG